MGRRAILAFYAALLGSFVCLYLELRLAALAFCIAAILIFGLAEERR